MQENHVDIFRKFESISFNEIVSDIYNQTDEAIWLSDESNALSNRKLSDLKKETLQNLFKQFSNRRLSDLNDSLKKPFSDKELLNKSSKLSSIVMASIEGITISESEFNILNFSWGLDIDPSLSLFFDPSHLQKNTNEFMYFGKNLQSIPFDIDLSEYFGTFINFQKEDSICLLL